LHDEEIDVTTAATGSEALQAINERHWDLCFLDIHLPDINGLDIMKRIRMISPGTRIVIMTGSEITDAVVQSVKENAHCLISKPFELDDVKKFVIRVLRTDKPLSRNECTAIQTRMSFMKWLAEDNRKHERKPISHIFSFFVVAPQSDKPAVLLTANALDVSDTGMCILTDCQLKPGHLLKLGHSAVQNTGVVRWSGNDNTTALYRAGIQFVETEGAPR
jgi:CheY-like chemotaxis protein